MTEQLQRAPEGLANRIETDYKVGQDNVQYKIGTIALDIHNPVFGISAVTIVAFVILTMTLPEQTSEFFGWLRPALTSNLDWFFLACADFFLILCLVLVVSPLGKVRLGGQDATPEYGYPGWFAMLFAAGMGIGLMFYGLSEPLTHFSSSFAEGAGSPDSWAPLGGAAGDAEEARRLALAATSLHWGLHAWGTYAIVALALALFAYNKGLPLTMRSVFYPIFGERVWGWPGHIIDILAIFATMFGLATSLGLGAEQVNAGLNFLFGIPVNDTSKVLIIMGITALALVSVVAGMDAGVKRLSEINIALAFLLLLFVIVVGYTMAIVTGFFFDLGNYLQYLPAFSNPFGRTDANFSEGWSSFYWAWWISWSPFVGMFIARVSRGRTVREFITCVLLIPSLICVLWITVFGGTAISQLVLEGYTAASEGALELKFFLVLSQLPFAQISSFIAIVLVIVFFTTSSDSGSLVIDTIAAGGKIDAPLPQRIFWCIFEGLVAMALLLAGGLGALQAMSLSTALPFSIVLLMACYAIVKGLASEPR